MSATTNQYNPDYAVSPGAILEERLAVQEISQAEFARRCGRSSKMISEIISGKAPLEPGTALQFEKVLGVDASIWLGIEADYQLHRARQREAEAASMSAEWLKEFPVKDLIKWGFIQRPSSEVDAMSKVLAFFGVGSAEAWRLQNAKAIVAYRHSKVSESSEKALATWRRVGEHIAESQECADFNVGEFKQAVREIRGLTRLPVNEAVARTTELCNKAGVAFAVVRPFPKTALSGAAWWCTPKKAIIQLSARYKSDDNLWFSFFHEAAHVILHSKKSIFMDDQQQGSSDLESEADEWAANMLIPKKLRTSIAVGSLNSEQAIQAFADEQGIAPGIVVGMLQYEGLLPRKRFNNLKMRYRWVW